MRWVKLLIKYKKWQIGSSLCKWTRCTWIIWQIWQIKLSNWVTGTNLPQVNTWNKLKCHLRCWLLITFMNNLNTGALRDGHLPREISRFFKARCLQVFNSFLINVLWYQSVRTSTSAPHALITMTWFYLISWIHALQSWKMSQLIKLQTHRVVFLTVYCVTHNLYLATVVSHWAKRNSSSWDHFELFLFDRFKLPPTATAFDL